MIFDKRRKSFSKKADKSLEIIFSIIVLVIVSVVLIIIFLSFMNKPKNLFDEGEFDSIYKNCMKLCSNPSRSDIVEFCKKKNDFKSLGQNEYGIIDSTSNLFFDEESYCFNILELKSLTKNPEIYGNCEITSSDCYETLSNPSDFLYDTDYFKIMNDKSLIDSNIRNLDYVSTKYWKFRFFLRDVSRLFNLRYIENNRLLQEEKNPELNSFDYNIIEKYFNSKLINSS